MIPKQLFHLVKEVALPSKQVGAHVQQTALHLAYEAPLGRVSRQTQTHSLPLSHWVLTQLFEPHTSTCDLVCNFRLSKLTSNKKIEIYF